MKSLFQHKHFFSVLLFGICLTSFISCKKYVEIPPPQTQVVDAVVFSTDQLATSAMVGTYSYLMTGTGLLNGYMSLYPGLAADEFIVNSSVASYEAYFSNSMDSKDRIIQGLWANGYKYIYLTNSIIEGLKQSPVSKPVTDQLTGEAKFLRALTYFYLVNLFGDVPLITTVDYQVNSSIPRSPVADVYTLMVQDLNDAVNLLPANYVTTDNFPTERIRPNKWTAAALLARVYLYLKDWKNAELQSSSVINSGMYQLEPDMNNVFLSTSKEAIFQLLPVSINTNSAEAQTFLTLFWFQKPAFNLTPDLLNAFEPNDLRMANWVSTQVSPSYTYIFPYKYKIASGSPPVEYNTVLRFAEQYLIRAEARAQQEDYSGAKEDLDQIRQRAGLPNTTADSKEEILSAIDHENRIEFFAEWGHRWFDLKRTGKIDNVLSISKPTWDPDDALWPIPFQEIQLNPFLTQNNGYN